MLILMILEIKMALLKKDVTATTVDTPVKIVSVMPASVEADPSDDDGDEVVVAKLEPKAAVKPIPVTAIAPVTSSSGLALSTKMKPVLEELKNALRVNFDTLPHLQINQGNLLIKEGKIMLGDEAILELLSYQDQFVVSPGEDGEEALSALRYSDDGITCSTGEDVQDYLKALQEADFPKAQLKARCVLVVNLLSASKGDKVAQHFDNLYQIDLAPSTKSKFDAYRAQVAFKCSRGKLKPEDSPFMVLKVDVVERNKNSWSVASFDTATSQQLAIIVR